MRRDDAADWQLLHVLELRQQHRLRVMEMTAKVSACDGESVRNDTNLRAALTAFVVRNHLVSSPW